MTSEASGSAVTLRALLESAIRASWGPETQYASEEYMAAGRFGDPARGQCGTTALVVQDWLGGDLIEADLHVGTTRLGVHYWNRLPNGEDLDLTRSQFVDGEKVSSSRVVARPPGPPPHGTAAYLQLRQRVDGLLAEDAALPGGEASDE